MLRQGPPSLLGGLEPVEGQSPLSRVINSNVFFTGYVAPGTDGSQSPFKWAHQFQQELR